MTTRHLLGFALLGSVLSPAFACSAGDSQRDREPGADRDESAVAMEVCTSDVYDGWSEFTDSTSDWVDEDNPGEEQTPAENCPSDEVSFDLTSEDATWDYSSGTGAAGGWSGTGAAGGYDGSGGAGAYDGSGGWTGSVASSGSSGSGGWDGSVASSASASGSGGWGGWGGGDGSGGTGAYAGTGSTTGSGGTGGYTTPVDPKETKCTIDTINGVVTKCCVDGYSGVKNCTNFANQFHNLCTVSGLDCKTVTISCNSGKSGHATNIVHIPGKGWCGVEPQNGTVYEPCVDDPKNLPADLVCKMGLQKPGCDCKVTSVSDKPMTPNTRPYECKQKGGTYGECTGCCGNHWWYKYCKKHNVKGCGDWYESCLNECKGLPIK
jgi:hypothetical protein